MINPVKNNLLDAGCSEESAVMVEQLCSKGLLDDALHQMRVIRCDLMEELHCEMSSVYRLRARAIEKLLHLRYGAGAGE